MVIGTNINSISAHQNTVPETIENKNPSRFSFKIRRSAYPVRKVPKKKDTCCQQNFQAHNYSLCYSSILQSS